jgi:PPM family protein phosphatase
VGVRLGRSAVVSDTGRRRRRNEDSYVCEPPLFAVADGMGGAQAGEVASGLAAAVLAEANGDELREERIIELIQEANRRVFKRSNEDPAASGMGTTMTVAVTGRDGKVLIGHVGDSRAYRIRGGTLEQLTKDHSLVGELMRSGKLSPEEAETHPQRSVITRAVGTEPDVDVDVFEVDAEAGDVFLLCSDGLTDMVSDDAIQTLLADREGELEGVARSLVEAANTSGGEDNITVLVFEIVDSASHVEDTVAMPAAPETVTSTADDEDTLSGLEPVPAVDTAVVSAAEIEEHLAATGGAATGGDLTGATTVERPTIERPSEAPTVERPAVPRRRLGPPILLVLLLATIALLVVWGLYR